MNTNENESSPFGPIVYTYTRAQAVADGFQVDVSKTAQEVGIRFPVFLTRAVYHAYVTVSPDVAGQDEAGRLWDILSLLRHAIRQSQSSKTRLPFALHVRNDNRRPRLVKLIATCGALDFDDPQSARKSSINHEDIFHLHRILAAGVMDQGDVQAAGTLPLQVIASHRSFIAMSLR